MNFERWGTRAVTTGVEKLMYADWKAEREEYMSINPKEYDWVTENTKLHAEREKLIGALEKIRQEKNCRLPECGCDEIARAVLAEVKEQG